MLKVSVIMPVYNSEEYLSKAVDSVLAQEFDGFELILVDDGSPDGSGAICDAYAAKDSRVLVIHKKNGGICSARNAALDVAQGEYIAFCDNDDEYLPGLLADNYKLAKEHDVDLMRYAKIKRVVKDNGKAWEIVYPIVSEFIETDAFAEHFANIRKENTVWTALYRRALIEEYKIRFDERFQFGSEDMDFNLKVLLHSSRLGFNDKAYYSWTQRSSSSTSRTFHRELLGCTRGINAPLEYRFLTKTCGGRVDDAVKNTFLVTNYIAFVLEYMRLPSCPLTKKEKLVELEKLRRTPLFDEKLSKETARKLRKENLRIYITAKLFYERRYRALILMLDKGTKILGLFRFKKQR